MIKYLFTLLLALAIQSVACAQKPVVICGNAFSFQDKYYSVAVLDVAKKAVGDEFIYLAQAQVDSSAKFKCSIALKRPQMVIVRYMNMRQRLYLHPGDSIHISFTKIDKTDTITTGIMTKVMKFIASSKVTGNDQPRQAFFQMLEDQTSPIDEVRFKIGKDSIADFMEFKTRISAQYQQRLKILNTAVNTHHFKPDFIAAAQSEITGAYLSALSQTIFVRFDWRKLPDYFNEVTAEQITWPKVMSSLSYPSFVYGYIMYFDKYVNRRGRVNEDMLTDKFNSIVGFKDDSVRNFYLTVLMSKSLEEKTETISQLMERFQQICTNKAFVEGIMALYQPTVLNKPLPDAVLNASLLTNNNQLLFLRDIIKTGKPTIIDFWASWCAPCIKEIPILARYQQKFGSQIDFRFVSVDQKAKHNDWLKAIRDKNFKGDHYLIQDEVLTKFAQLKTIPRYLILDKQGKLSVFRGPNMLDDENGFEQALKAVL